MAPPVLAVTHFSDPGCPWAYSASPAHAVLRWRFGAQLDWRLVLIGLAETPERYLRNGSTPARQATGYLRYERRFGMPFGRTPRRRIAATGPACRAVVATRLLAPAREHAVFRALQFAHFTTPAVFDEPEDLRAALAPVDDIDADAVVAAIDAPETIAAYEADRAEARTAAGGPTEAQGRAADTDGAVRFTAPSLQFTAPGGATLEVGGFQPLEAYDVAIANLAPELERRDPSDDVVAVLGAFPDGLTTAELVAIATPRLGEPDRPAIEAALLAAAADGAIRATPLGQGTLWRPAG